ncbi:acid protease [Apiospora marii]|uniref:acid protease n=1 Tax=Apiospora marii TaxID=335849 RepID=UPI00312E92ED
MIRPNINPDGPANKNWLVELGETFLRHAYVVYDFENRQVGLARRGAKIPLGIPVPAVQTPVKYNTSTHTFYDYPVTKLGVFLAAPGIRSSSLGQSGRYEKDLAIGLGVGLSLGFVAILAA